MSKLPPHSNVVQPPQVPQARGVSHSINAFLSHRAGPIYTYELALDAPAEEVLERVASRLGKPKEEVMKLGVNVLLLVIEAIDEDRDVAIVEPGAGMSISKLLGLQPKE